MVLELCGKSFLIWEYLSGFLLQMCSIFISCALDLTTRLTCYVLLSVCAFQTFCRDEISDAT